MAFLPSPNSYSLASVICKGFKSFFKSLNAFIYDSIIKLNRLTVSISNLKHIELIYDKLGFIIDYYRWQFNFASII
jgi:hypothetical protein